MAPTIESFEDFWPYYARAHSKKATRLFHFIGTVLALLCLPAALGTQNLWYLAMGPILGYGPAWFSHFFIEGNKPATFGHPLYSLRGDFVMLWMMMQGTMDDEVARVVGEHTASKAAEQAVAA